MWIHQEGKKDAYIYITHDPEISCEDSHTVKLFFSLKVFFFLINISYPEISMSLLATGYENVNVYGT